MVELDSGPGLSDCRVCASNPSLQWKIPLRVGEGECWRLPCKFLLALRYWGTEVVFLINKLLLSGTCFIGKSHELSAVFASLGDVCDTCGIVGKR